MSGAAEVVYLDWEVRHRPGSEDKIEGILRTVEGLSERAEASQERLGSTVGRVSRLRETAEQKLSGALRERIAQQELLLGSLGRGSAAEDAATRAITQRVAAVRAGLQPGAAAAANIERLAGTLHDLKSQTDAATAASRRQGSALHALGGNIQALASSYAGMRAVDAIRDAVAVGAAWERQTLSLRTAAGGAAAAGEEMKFLRGETGRLGIALNGTVGSYAKFLAASTSLSRADQRTLFLGTAEAATSLGLAAEDVNGILRAYGQIASKGKVQTEELNQIAERLPGAFSRVADSMGMTSEVLRDKLQRGLVSATTLLPLLGQALRAEFGEAAAANVNSVTASINRFENSVLGAKVAFAGGFAGGLTTGLADAGKELDGLNGSLATLGQLLGFILSMESKWLGLVGSFAKAPIEIGKWLAAGIGGSSYEARVQATVAATEQAAGATRTMAAAQRYRAEETDSAATAEERLQKASLTAKVTRQAAETTALAEALGRSREEYEELLAAKKLGIDVTDGLSAAERGLVTKVDEATKALEKQEAVLARMAAKELKAAEAIAARSANYASAVAAMVDFQDQVLSRTSFGDNSLATGVTDANKKAYDQVRATAAAMLDDMKRNKEAAVKIGEEQGAAFAAAVAGPTRDALGALVGESDLSARQIFANFLDGFKNMLLDALTEWIAHQAQKAATDYQDSSSSSSSSGGMGGLNISGAGAALGIMGLVYSYFSADNAKNAQRIIDGRANLDYSQRTGFGDGDRAFGEVGYDANREIEARLEGILAAIGGFAESLPSLEIDIRRDGTDLAVTVGGMFLGMFGSIEQAMDAALTETIRQGTFSGLGENVRAVLERNFHSVEELLSAVDFARALDEAGMTEFERELSQWSQNMRATGQEVARLGLSMGSFAEVVAAGMGDFRGGIMSQIEQFLPGYDAIGDKYDELKKKTDAYNAALGTNRDELQKQLEAYLEQLNLMYAKRPDDGGNNRPGTGIGDDPNADRGGSGHIGGSPGGGRDIAEMIEWTERWGAAAGLTADQLRAEIDRITAALGSMEAIDPALLEQAEAEERRRNRRRSGPSRADELEALGERMVAVERSALDDFDARLLEHQDAWAAEIAAAGRLGFSIERVTAARRIEAEAMAQELRDRAEGLADGGNASLGDRRAEITAGFEEIRRQNDALLAQEGVLALTRWQINQLETQALQNLANQAVASLGLPMEQLRERFDVLRDTLGTLWASAYDGTITFERMREILDQLATQGEAELYGLAAGILETMGASDEAARYKAYLEEANFLAQVAQLNFIYQQMSLLGFVSDEVRDRMAGLLGFINDPANWPDFTVPLGGGRGGGFGGYEPPLEDPGADLERLRQQVMDQIEAWERLELSPNERRLAELQDRITEVNEMALEAGLSATEMARLQAAANAAIADFWRGVTDPIREFYDSLGLSQFSPAGGRERLAQAESEFGAIAARLRDNPRDLAALEQLQAVAQSYLTEAQAFTGGQGPLYSRIFAEVQAILAGVLGLAPDVASSADRDTLTAQGGRLLGGADRFPLGGVGPLERQGLAASGGTVVGGSLGNGPARPIADPATANVPVVRSIDRGTELTVAAIEDGTRRLERRLERIEGHGAEVAQATGSAAQTVAGAREDARRARGSAAEREAAAAAMAAAKRERVA